MSQPIKLPPDERIWPLKPEVLLARGKGELQAKEEKAVRGAVKEAVATYKNEIVSLVENNMEDRKRAAKMLVKSAEEAEEILVRECTYDKNKRLKYRGKCAIETSENIDQEIAKLNNVLNDISNKRKQRTKTLLDQQKTLATMQVAEEYGVNTFPEEEQQCRQLECNLEKLDQKLSAADRCRHKYRQFINTLQAERKLNGPRLENLKKCIKQDIYDLEVCHDIMMKGHILSQDASGSLEEATETYTNEKKDRDHDLKSLRKEVLKKADQAKGKKATLTEVNLDKVLKGQQNMFAQLQERRKTIAELENWSFNFEALREVTRGTNMAGVVAKFEGLVERHTYLSNERERIETQRQAQLQALQDQQAVLSSVGHTGATEREALDGRLAELQNQLRSQQARRDAAEEQLHVLGSSLSGTRATLRQMLRALKFVSRPQGWSRRTDQNEMAGDLELLRLKLISLQQRFVALGAPLRPDSQLSVRSEALDAPKAQYRVGRQARDSLISAEMGKVDDMEPVRMEMKNMSEEFVKKMTSRGRRPP
ncbi:uncharacterized protein LOC122377055 [Amphibalanus amphitrite]|uniref:uncharacterized protein LOC122377055 n=1 Tax=Amphibalanus amphitrite TaxID=1232801 RepID=UPI001C90E826|nr:uncharacterized protein LOC122377055 [Amphibalanus amphitrite]